VRRRRGCRSEYRVDNPETPLSGIANENVWWRSAE
jgi:hypothetical protein